ncbi:hypothetical protein MBLNU457_g0514t1 [Dothideomycetes sp. NU457]
MVSNDQYLPATHTSESFSASLDDAFASNPIIASLSESVEEKKRTLDSRAEELAAIESRLRETEERLARASREKESASGRMHSQSQQAYSGAESVSQSQQSYEPAEQIRYTRAPSTQPSLRQIAASTRPSVLREDSLGTSRMPGAFQETPLEYTARDYTLVDRTR